VEMQNPQQILDQGRGDAPSDVASDNRLPELGTDDGGGVDTRVDARDQVELLAGDERNLGNVVLGVGGRELGVPLDVVLKLDAVMIPSSCRTSHW